MEPRAEEGKRRKRGREGEGEETGEGGDESRGKNRLQERNGLKMLAGVGRGGGRMGAWWLQEIGRRTKEKKEKGKDKNERSGQIRLKLSMRTK